ncbi:winged helix DNA-binding domain-containing protein [Mucilaginibacter sp.]|uniref:winged helix DNA-binding domain-containing protein n=1 Tax=Mucilaginibacter sp. TaxID=1882438 RepID=UPI002628DE3D|nr:winged helix DNA-binding domain-containing protein [Mucilaginibacter sp.]MDB5030486.1 Winged helix DNA-binding protein [Mucilaginibacter sp.]
MSNRDILQQRLINQQLMGLKFTKAHELVSYMGCIQAQDFYGAKWALGTRIKGLTDTLVEKEFNEGKIIRTHVLRPTWHFVSPGDIGWMLKLTAPQVKKLMAGYLVKEGIDSAILKQSKKIFETALTGGNQLSREELIPLLKGQNIKTGDNHLSFLLLDAELDGLICSGARKGKQFTYMLLQDRVPDSKYLDKDEALAELAKRYFISRGPATVHDFAWWSGLTITDAKRGLELSKPNLDHQIINGQAYWFLPVITEQKLVNTVRLLPAYDEYYVAYKNRSFGIDDKHNTLSGSGIFKPPVVVNGQIAGSWKRIEKKDKVFIEIEPFVKVSNQIAQKIVAEAKRYARFFDKKSEVAFPTA